MLAPGRLELVSFCLALKTPVERRSFMRDFCDAKSGKDVCLAQLNRERRARL